MAGSFKLTGTKNFMQNLNKEITDMRGRTHRGLIEAAIVLQRKAEPGTPVDLGNLRASWFIVSYKSGSESDAPTFKGKEASDMGNHHKNVERHAQALASRFANATRPVIIFGYSANYAPFVHEHVGASFKRPNARARWLFAAMQQAKDDMLDKIREHARFR